MYVDTALTFPPALPHKVSTDLLALSCSPHSNSTVDLCPKRETDFTHLLPEPVEVTSLGLEFQRQKTGTSGEAVMEKGSDGVRDSGRCRSNLFVLPSLFYNDTLQDINVRRKGHMCRKNICPSEISSLHEFPSNPLSKPKIFLIPGLAVFQQRRGGLYFSFPS